MTPDSLWRQLRPEAFFLPRLCPRLPAVPLASRCSLGCKAGSSNTLTRAWCHLDPSVQGGLK